MQCSSSYCTTQYSSFRIRSPPHSISMFPSIQTTPLPTISNRPTRKLLSPPNSVQHMGCPTPFFTTRMFLPPPTPPPLLTNNDDQKQIGDGTRMFLPPPTPPPTLTNNDDQKQSAGGTITKHLQTQAAPFQNKLLNNGSGLDQHSLPEIPSMFSTPSTKIKPRVLTKLMPPPLIKPITMFAKKCPNPETSNQATRSQ